MTAPSSLITHTTVSLAGGLMVQRMAARAIDFEALPEDDRLALVRSTAAELSALGLDPEILAQIAISSFRDLFTQTGNRDAVVDGASRTLWLILGPGEGGQPPEIYHRAAIAMHYIFTELFAL
jgi:hypothetical protein